MDRRKLLGATLLALPLAVGGVVFAASQAPTNGTQAQQATDKGYNCPATGEELPCPKCCPLNQRQ